MDHILANQDEPVPEAASISTLAQVLPTASGGGDIDEDEDVKAAIALSQDGAEAKVRGKRRERSSTWEVVLIDWLVRAVDQVFRVWQDFQEYRACRVSVGLVIQKPTTFNLLMNGLDRFLRRSMIRFCRFCESPLNLACSHAVRRNQDTTSSKSPQRRFVYALSLPSSTRIIQPYQPRRSNP